MKSIITQILPIWIATISTIAIPQLAQAQVPNIVDSTAPATQKGTPAIQNTAAISKLEVRCQDLKTVVKKDDGIIVNSGRGLAGLGLSKCVRLSSVSMAPKRTKSPELSLRGSRDIHQSCGAEAWLRAWHG